METNGWFQASAALSPVTFAEDWSSRSGSEYDSLLGNRVI
jgi:hypothetical protein